MPRFHNRYEQNPLRKNLRNNLTKPEVVLWSYLKGRQFNGYKFRRQHGIGRYVVDFFCPRLRLAIELDGGQHRDESSIEYDKERDAWLASLGIEILRIGNDELFSNRDGVFDKLEDVMKRRGRLLDHLLQPHSRRSGAGYSSSLEEETINRPLL